MKKEFKLLGMLLIAAIIVVSGCKKDDDTLPAINVGFKYAPENPIAGQEITFTNASNGGTEYMWDFGDGETSTEQNPAHTYTASGDYTVILKVDNREDATATKTVTVQDQVPTITADVDDSQMQIGVPITFTGTIYNPGGATVTYEWTFPDGKVLGDNVLTGESVTVTFIEANEDPGYTVELKATVDKAYTATKTVTIKNQLAKTVYYAVKGGNLMMKKIYANGEAQVVDMGVPSGQHPFNIQIAGDRLYIFDAGEVVKYKTDPVGIETVPGSIVSMALDGTAFKNHITFTDHAYDDAYSGYVVTDEGDGSGNIYWHDRNSGMYRIDIASENLIFDAATMAAYASNSANPWYAISDPVDYMVWGACSGGTKKIDGVYWQGVYYNGSGLLRFEDADIGQAVVPSAGAILGEFAIREFAVDKVNNKVYFSAIVSNKVATDLGFYVADIDGSNITLIDNSPAVFENGGFEEIYITGIDVDNESGYVYWAYRGPELDSEGNPIDYEANPLYKSGIKRFKLDGSGDIEYFVEDVDAYGLTIDHTKR